MTSKRFRISIWGTDMRGGSTLLAAVLALTGSAMAAPVMPLVSDGVPRTIGSAVQSHDEGLILVQHRGGGGGMHRGGGGAQRPQRSAGAANRGGFNSRDFHQNVSNSRNFGANRNTNINANRNVNVAGGGWGGGGCCYGGYNSGPSWGGVAAGDAVGALGAAAISAASTPAYAAPPPYYPPGYVYPPPY